MQPLCREARYCVQPRKNKQMGDSSLVFHFYSPPGQVLYEARKNQEIVFVFTMQHVIPTETSQRANR